MGTGRADAVVVGAGLAGSAAARDLASRGRSVVLVEAFQPGHRRGSSHGSARIFRRAYPDPLYVRLTGQAQVQAFHFAPRDPGSWPVFMHHDEIVRYGLPAGRDGEVPGAVKIGEHG
ncbi:MAG: FAD-dependent oxidoreductase, partial [Streptosporangiaceae bacterium]